MKTFLRVSVLVLLAYAAPAFAQESEQEGQQEGEQTADGAARAGVEVTPLEAYLDALSGRRLLSEETGSVERLRELVRVGEDLYLAERYGEAALNLFEVAESPQFADFVDLDEFRGAEFMLARSLEQLGALRTAARYLEHIVERGPDDVYFGPAMRKYVDVVLRSGNISAGIERLEALGAPDMDITADNENELFYLRGRELYDAQDWAAADAQFDEITRRSRWYAAAQYLRGVAAARQGNLEAAEERFCAVATQGDDDRFTFYVDDRYFEVKDLARLALGRVAHEGQRADDAFYYYFQVPADSERVSEALFEAAYSMYEGSDFETAIDLLDQLEARFPQSAFIDEASLLRGYVHLGRCEFEDASQLFQRFAGRFGPIVQEIDLILESEPRQARLYEELLAEEARGGAATEDDAELTTRGLLLAMLRVDPAFYRLHADVHTLDSEAARAGRLSTDLRAILGRIQGDDAPLAAAELDDGWDDTGDVRREIAAARAVLRSLTAQVDAMRGAGATAEQLGPLDEELRGLAGRVTALERTFQAALTAAPDDAGPDDDASGLEGMLRRDVVHAQRLPGRVAATRAHMVDAANDAALHGLNRLRHRLGGELRRARIGRIDAVMGSKRRVEIQVESLSAGRFPPELMDPLRIQGLLRDDEEYWPFEGELWEDEFDETDPIDELLEGEEG
ncbi:MAG: outer membrane protein assembly factor BamD [Deltaproteobacteria bacterium]|nr:outer membrane protein assembly factor BamD [Deltaproteobacteria bacterium]